MRRRAIAVIQEECSILVVQFVTSACTLVIAAASSITGATARL
jgi:hypothetical protein